MAGIGRQIRDHDGDLIIAQSYKTLRPNTEHAEEMILLHGLSLAISIQVQQLLINGGCLGVQQLYKHKGILMLESCWISIR